MAGGQLDPFFRHLRRLVLPRAAAELTDAQLLERFVQARDEVAFELLLWRHGPMVFRVCLRVLRRHHDAEDAFQATFLALAQKASTIRRTESLGSWLHKVAHRLALRAGAAMPARPLPAHLLPDCATTEPLLDVLSREVRSAVDEEVNRLPDKYRLAFVMCQVEGRTIAAAAQALGCPPATVGTRLARARQLLRRRLARRGFGAVLNLCLIPVLREALVSATVRAALFGTAAEAAAAGLIPAHIATLAKGALRTMPSTKWILTTAVVLALSLLAGGGAFLALHAQAEQPRVVQRDETGQPPTGEDQATLQWRFQKDKVFYQEMTVVTRQAVKYMSGTVKATREQTFYLRWRPVGQDKDGNWLLKQKVEAVRIVIHNMDGTTVKYDSRQDDGTDDHLIAWHCRSFVGSEFTVTFGDDSKVHKVEGRDELIRKLSAADPRRNMLSQQALGETTLLQAAEILLNPLNPKAVRPGDSWTCEQVLDCPLIGKIESRYRFSYGRWKGKAIRIPVQSTLEVRNLKGKGKELKGKGTGTVLFDRERGRIVSEELDLQLKGRIDVASQGLNLIPNPATLIHTEAELTESVKITVKTSDAKQTRLRGE